MRTPRKWLEDKLDITHLKDQIVSVSRENKATQKQLKVYMDISNNNRKVIEANLEKCYHECKGLSEASYALLSHFNISANVGVHGQSWMVVSIKGKQDLVYFRNLDRMDVRSIVEFMGQFKGTNRTADVPVGAEHLFAYFNKSDEQPN